MTWQHVGHRDIVRFALNSVNLPKRKAKRYRAQAQRLREKIDARLSENPDFSLRRTLLSGSIAKGTALSHLNDIDLACYISGADTPRDVYDLLDYLAERLRRAFPDFRPEQVEPQTYSVKVSFRGTGLDVDVVPILYNGDPQWYGKLVSQDDGSLLETNIPLHLDFIRRRKAAREPHFAQVVRLVKFWAHMVKNEQPDFRFKSFMIEMILSRLCDRGLDFSDYPEALQHFFTYVARTGMREKIVFTDHYRASEVGRFPDPVQIIDPVNPKNNVASRYTDEEADAIVKEALAAGDDIDAALAASTKREAVYYWQKVFGPAFQVRRGTAHRNSNTGIAAHTGAHAFHIAAKVATDLKRMQRFYDNPTDEWIHKFEIEAAVMVWGGYADKVTYGFQKDGNWIEPALCYKARDPSGRTVNDDPGQVSPGAPTGGASFNSYLAYTSAWDELTPEQAKISKMIPFQRTDAPEPGFNGRWVGDRTYSAGGSALYRSSLRS